MKKKMISILVVVLIITTGVFTGCGTSGSSTVEFPTDTLNVLVPYSAGGGCDQYARLVGNYLDTKGNNYVVTNIAGGGSIVGTTELLTYDADGYNWLYTSITALVSSYYTGAADYKIYEDLTPIGFATVVYFSLLAQTDSQWDTLDDLIEYCKAHPGEVTMGVPGNASAGHIAALLFADAAGVELNYVPYSSAADTKAALAGGHVDIASLGITDAYDFIDSGYFKCFGVSSAERLKHPTYVDTPTFIEQGLNYEFDLRNGVLVKKGTPQEAIDYWAEAYKNVVENPDFVADIEKIASLVDYMGPEEAQEYMDQLFETIGKYEQLF